MKTLSETPIGNLQPTTFRPTEAEKLVLLNIADMTEQGRTVTQQDAINIPEEKLKEKDIGEDNVESAYAQLVKLKMIEAKPDQTLQISAVGQPVVAELKKAEDQAALTAKSDGADDQQSQGQTPPGSMDGQSMQQDPTFAQENFTLIAYLNDWAKLV